MREPSNAEVMRKSAQAAVNAVWTSAPGVIVAYDEDTKTATVEITAYSGDPPPPLPNVPVKFWRCGGFRIYKAPAAGDEVTVHFYQADPSRFRVTGKAAAANIQRKHGPAYAVAVLGTESDPGRSAYAGGEGLHIGTDDGSVDIVITESEIKLGADATDKIALDSAVIDALTQLKSAIAGATVTPTDGGASFKAGILAALSAWPPMSVGATKAKAE